VATLLSLANQTYTQQTLNLGPFGVVPYRGQSVRVTLTATSWPASGQIVSASFTYDTGDGGGAGFSGSTIPDAKGHYPSLQVSVPQTASTVALQIIVSQSFTSPVLVTTQ
jgi:hypothetical protein